MVIKSDTKTLTYYDKKIDEMLDQYPFHQACKIFTQANSNNPKDVLTLGDIKDLAVMTILPLTMKARCENECNVCDKAIKPKTNMVIEFFELSYLTRG